MTVSHRLTFREFGGGGGGGTCELASRRSKGRV